MSEKAQLKENPVFFWVLSATMVYRQVRENLAAGQSPTQAWKDSLPLMEQMLETIPQMEKESGVENVSALSDKILEGVEEAKSRNVSAERRFGSVLAVMAPMMASLQQVVRQQGIQNKAAATIMREEIRWWPALVFTLREYVAEGDEQS